MRARGLLAFLGDLDLPAETVAALTTLGRAVDRRSPSSRPSCCSARFFLCAAALAAAAALDLRSLCCLSMGVARPALAVTALISGGIDLSLSLSLYERRGEEGRVGE